MAIEYLSFSTTNTWPTSSYSNEQYTRIWDISGGDAFTYMTYTDEMAPTTAKFILRTFGPYTVDGYTETFGTYTVGLTSTTTVEQTSPYGKTTTSTDLFYFPTVVNAGTSYALEYVLSTITQTVGGTESMTYAGLAVTEADTMTTFGAVLLWNTIVVADTALGEFLIVPTKEGEGMLSDLCTTATATTFSVSVFGGGGDGGAQALNEIDYYTTTTTSLSMVTKTATDQIAVFPALTSSHTYVGYTECSTIADGSSRKLPLLIAHPYWTGPAAAGYFPQASTTGMWPVYVYWINPLPTVPNLVLLTSVPTPLFSESAFAFSMAAPPSTTNFTASARFAQAVDAGVMVGSNPAEQWVSIFPGVIMPLPADTFLLLNHTQDSDAQGACDVTTSASVSYGSGGYSVRTATAYTSNTTITRGGTTHSKTTKISHTGSNFYSFSGLGMTSTVTQLDSIAGGNPYFPNATYAGGEVTLELQTWNASSSGLKKTTFKGRDNVFGEGLSIVVPNVSATAYSYLFDAGGANYLVTSFA
jgi:hypothetical protein